MSNEVRPFSAGNLESENRPDGPSVRVGRSVSRAIRTMRVAPAVPEPVLVRGNHIKKRGFNLWILKENYYTNASISPVGVIMCGKLHCQ